MILQHYAQLFRHYRRWVVWGVLLSTFGTCGLSMVWLSVSPRYTATASIAMLPTEAEFAFGRETVGGPRSTIRGLTATYVEYLKSRPVIEATFDKIAGTLPQEAASGATAGPLARLVRGSSAFLRRTFRVLDSGAYVPTDPREAALRDLMDAITLRSVPDSYILHVEVSLSTPGSAVAVANALAEAYVERISQQLNTSASEMEAFLRGEIGLRDAALKKLVGREETLKRDLGTPSLEDERRLLIAARETERQKLVDSQIEWEAASSDLQLLNREDLARSGRNLAEMNEARARAAARREAAQRGIQLRNKTIRDLTTSLDSLNSKDEPLEHLQLQRFTTERELAELHTRVLSTDLARSAAMTQVRVIDPAVLPVYPSSPRVVVNTLVATVLSVLLALFGLVAIDTVSGTVKTTPDLARLVGPRCLGRLDHRSVSLARTSASRPSSQRDRRLRALGARLERQLVLLGAFEAPVMLVTGFADVQQLREAARTLQVALAGLGRRLAETVPVRGSVAVAGEGAFGGRLQLAVKERSTSEPGALRIECLDPISADLSFSDVANRSPALVCVVPAGEVAESLVEDLLRKGEAAGLSAISFVLVGP